MEASGERRREKTAEKPNFFTAVSFSIFFPPETEIYFGIQQKKQMAPIAQVQTWKLGITGSNPGRRSTGDKF